EGNTTFGFDVSAQSLGSDTSRDARSSSEPPSARESPPAKPSLFREAVVYRFPLHVAQLRNDAASQPVGTISLLPNAIVPLNFHETKPPADQLPALRPQMTSPVVEATMSNLLDAIHHDDISGVGIIATDPRDVLFLAREVKKAAPDVQVFLTGA